MDIYDALVAKLKATAALTALVGTRIYPNGAPQGSLPAVFYLTVDDIKLYTHDGISAQESPNIQFTVYADTVNQAAAVAEQIRTALHGYTGTLSGITVQIIRLINELPSSYEMETKRVYTHDLEFEVVYERS